MKRMLALLLCLVFCLSLLPAAFAVEIVEPAAEEPEEEIRLVEIAEEPVFEEKPNADGSIVYRALLIGEVSFDRETANRNRGDVERISEMLGNVVGPAGSAYDVTSKYDLSYSGIESAISSAFSGADSNDVSLFFMATHGVTNLSSGTYAGALETIEEPGVTTDLLPLEDLAAWLNAVPGKIIVVLGSCGSGAAIYADGKTTVMPSAGEEADAAFTGAVIRTFAQADEDMRAPGAAEPQTGEFRSSKYYVLTAAAHQESSWGQESEDSEYCYNAFPFFFAQGGYYKPNYYYSESGHTQGDMMADSDGNNVVTLNEMYQYVYDKAYGPYSSDGQDYYQHAQVYPSDSSYPLFGNSGNSCASGHDWGEWETLMEPTCTEDGVKSRTCSRCGECEMQAIEAPGHDYHEAVTEPTCTEQGYTTYTCSRCGDYYMDNYVEALGHDYHETVTEPTCTEQGCTTYTCSRCGDSYIDGCVDALGHDWGEWETLMEPTCTEDGVKSRTCARCGECEMQAIAAPGHDYQETVTEPTCTEQGYTTYTCRRCGDYYLDNYVEALGHDYHDTVTEPTCTTGGYTTHVCSRCSDSYLDSYTDALGHDYGEPDWAWSDDYFAAAATFSCGRCDESETLDAEISFAPGSSQTLATAKVTFINKDYQDTKTIRLSISETKLTLPVSESNVLELFLDSGAAAKAEWSSSNPTAATVDGDGKVTAHKYGKATVTGTAYGLSFSCEVQTLFWDVTDPSVYYFKHVYWAADMGITKGYDLEYFAPQEECPREQMMTFLWRMAGKPNPKTTTNKFSDVKKTDYFYKAILWASENKIANGYEDGTYGVGLACLREHMVTFLSKYDAKFGNH